MVHEGDDGWLFLVGGSNDPLFLYRRSWARFSLIWNWAKVLRARHRRCRALGIRYIHVPVPEKTVIYDDKLGGLAINPRLGLARPLTRLMPRVCLDLLAPLREGRSRAETFMKTDTHWTPEGCRIAHDVICRAVGAPLRWRLEDRPILHLKNHLGDLGSKLDPPRRQPIDARRILSDARRIQANALLTTAERNKTTDLHQGALVVFRNDALDADPRRVVLFGDSYSSYVATGLTAMLAETFRELHFIWYPHVDWGYVERVKPDIVLTEIAERFKVIVPPLPETFDNEAFAAAKLAEFETEA
jgi:hypothetical protein